MKKLIALLVLSTSVFANSSNEHVFVNFEGNKVDILNVSNLDENGLNALPMLQRGACYTGNQFEVINSLNEVFNLAEKQDIADEWPIYFKQATTPKLHEHSIGLSDHIGIEYEVKANNFSVVRFTIGPCR